MKYVNTGVVFQEIPDEVTLSINISACPCHCIGCHSEYLWDDIGEPLNIMSLSTLLKEYGNDITCICFMGGDAEPASVNSLAEWVRKEYPNLKIGWYSGRSERAADIRLQNFDFIKLGPYIDSKGGLNNRDTNQVMYKVIPPADGSKKYTLENITSKFWKK